MYYCICCLPCAKRNKMLVIFFVRAVAFNNKTLAVIYFANVLGLFGQYATTVY